MTDSLYQQQILDLATEGASDTTLEAPHGSARIDNPLCGDRVDCQVRMDGSIIREIGFKVRGCRLCEAGAALVSRTAPSMKVDDWLVLAEGFEAVVRDDAPSPEKWQETKAFSPVHAHRSRHDCPLLPLQALQSAIADATKK